MPQRVQRTRKAGQPGIPKGAVYVGRGPGDHGRYGNPFVIGKDADDATHASALYREWLENNSYDVHGPNSSPEHRQAMDDRRDWILEHLADLAGKDLACWCPLPADGEDDACHGAVLLLAANDYMAPTGSGVCDRCRTWDLLPHRHPRCPECGRPWDRRKLPRPEDCTKWGVYCPHGKQIVERDPDRTDPEGYPVGRLVDPWPCTVDGCTLEVFEQHEQEREDEYWESLLSEVPR